MPNIQPFFCGHQRTPGGRWWITLLTVWLAYFAHPSSAAARNFFDDGWRFRKGEVAGAEVSGYKGAGWRQVTLPHDWAIEGPFDKQYNARAGGLPFHGVGWYCKTFTVPKTDRDKRVFTEFDDAMNTTTVGGSSGGFGVSTNLPSPGLLAKPTLFVYGAGAGSSFIFNVPVTVPSLWTSSPSWPLNNDPGHEQRITGKLNGTNVWTFSNTNNSTTCFEVTNGVGKVINELVVYPK